MPPAGRGGIFHADAKFSLLLSASAVNIFNPLFMNRQVKNAKKVSTAFTTYEKRRKFHAFLYELLYPDKDFLFVKPITQIPQQEKNYGA